MEIKREILGYYDLGLEDTRLTARPSLEFLRTQLLLSRFLPDAPARILDVGGGSGVHARRLMDQGHTVDLIDPVPLHREQARARGVPARSGDARRLTETDGSYDAVLLLGPLYHLPERADRIAALTEAARVVRPGGVVIVAVITRYASLFDGYYRGYVDRPGFAETIRQDLRDGRHHNPTDEPERFTTAYFHTYAEVFTELTDAGLYRPRVLPVEGPLHWAPQISDRLADPQQRALVLDLLATIEDDPALAAASSHLLAVGWAN